MGLPFASFLLLNRTSTFGSGLPWESRTIPDMDAPEARSRLTVVVEPAAIVDEEAQGLRALYVALTRATKRLAIVHARDLPDALQE